MKAKYIGNLPEVAVHLKYGTVKAKQGKAFEITDEEWEQLKNSPIYVAISNPIQKRGEI